MHYIGSLVLIVWLIIGAVAAGQRNDYTRPPANCSQAATIAVTTTPGTRGREKATVPAGASVMVSTECGNRPGSRCGR